MIPGQNGPKVTMNVRDLRNALSDIASDIDAVQELVARYERTNGFHEHMQMVFAMSGLEIKMSNFARDMREKFTG